MPQRPVDSGEWRKCGGQHGGPRCLLFRLRFPRQPLAIGQLSPSSYLPQSSTDAAIQWGEHGEADATLAPAACPDVETRSGFPLPPTGREPRPGFERRDPTGEYTVTPKRWSLSRFVAWHLGSAIFPSPQLRVWCGTGPRDVCLPASATRLFPALPCLIQGCIRSPIPSLLKLCVRPIERRIWSTGQVLGFTSIRAVADQRSWFVALNHPIRLPSHSIRDIRGV